MSKRKDPGVVIQPHAGKPTTYKPEYCEMLVEWMGQGYSFGSFGSQIGTHRATLYDWANRYPEFDDAKKRAFERLERHYLDMGRAIATGQLRRVKSERPVVDKKGKPVLDPKTGQVLIEREYESTQGNAAAWIFLTKNLLHFRNEEKVTHTVEETKTLHIIDVSTEQRMREIKDMTQALAKMPDADIEIAKETVKRRLHGEIK